MVTARRIKLTLEAKPVPGAIEIKYVTEFEGESYIYVDIDPEDPWGSWKAFPPAVEYASRLYGKSSYDSDRNVGVYRTGLPIVRAVKVRKA